jgi:hypothetical protein
VARGLAPSRLLGRVRWRRRAKPRPEAGMRVHLAQQRARLGTQLSVSPKSLPTGCKRHWSMLQHKCFILSNSERRDGVFIPVETHPTLSLLPRDAGPSPRLPCGVAVPRFAAVPASRRSPLWGTSLGSPPWGASRGPLPRRRPVPCGGTAGQTEQASPEAWHGAQGRSPCAATGYSAGAVTDKHSLEFPPKPRHYQSRPRLDNPHGFRL